MESLADILRTITEEMQKSLSARTVVGDPITIEGKTIVPLVSIGLAFGAGSGVGKNDSTPQGGGGGGMGIKPVAVIIIDPQDVKVERLKATKHSLVAELAEAVPRRAKNLPRKKKEQAELEG